MHPGKNIVKNEDATRRLIGETAIVKAGAPDATEAEPQWPELQRVHCAVVVLDIVNSVGLIRQHELDVIDRWRRFVFDVRSRVLPGLGGRFVKSTGDGMLLSFDTANAAAEAMFAAHSLLARDNEGRSADARIELRGGGHVAEVVVIDGFDVFGDGVNVAARITSLARPGGNAVTAEFRADIVPGLDAEVEDIGECYVKNLDDPLRAFRLHPLGWRQRPADRPAEPGRALQPVLAVLPFVGEVGAALPPGLAAALTDDICAALARVASWTSISRLSTQALAGRSVTPVRLAELTGAGHLVRGKLGAEGNRVVVHIEVLELRTEAVIWSAVESQQLDDVFAPDYDLSARLVRGVARGLLERELSVAHDCALPNLPGYRLLLHSISRLHSLASQDMQRSRESLEQLVDRHSRSPEARGWLANWHFLQLAQHTSRDRAEDAGRARAHLELGLAERDDHAFSLALLGHMKSFVEADNSGAERLLRLATACGSNEPVAWLFLANLLAHDGRAAEAVVAVERAAGLSPLDPLAYMFDVIAATVYSAAGQSERAIEFGERSLRLNALHLSTWAQLIIDLMLVDRADEARTLAAKYLVMQPGASVARFFDRHPANGTALARRDAEALLAAGLPH